MTVPEEPLAQLSEASRQAAARVETLGAELLALRRRQDAVEQQLAGTGAAVHGTVERLEAVHGELARIGRLETALGQLRDEMVREHAERQRELRAEVAGLQARLAGESERLSLETARLLPRLEQVEALPSRLDNLERERAALARALQAAEARVDAVAAERAAIAEELRRSEQRLQARLETIQAGLREQETELGQWRSLIESQSETVREARAVADHMQEEVGRIRHEGHALAETERVFEQRVEGTLTAARREAAEEWLRFGRQREADWTMLRRANEGRDHELQALAEGLAALLARVAALEARLDEGLVAREAETEAIRRDLGAALADWRQTLGSATEILEAAVGRAEAPAALEERRQALRRALREQRAHREG